PPNITGQLHMGHALDNTMQDILIRTKRMQGFSALWLPGTDHASIATELKIVEKMAEEGLTKQDVGRKKFLERAWAWKEQYGGRIIDQLKKLGSSCDWERERFTMDEGCNKAVTEVFVNLYNKGLIYRGNRIINWCTDCRTALSDAEVEYEEEKSHLWHIRYDSEDGTASVTVATTRPETMLGDTAVAVNPEDERYKDLVGKYVILPLMNRKIPVIADEYVDMEFGTGAVKITPAHDPNDFEVAQRHDLPSIRVMDDNGVMNSEAGKYCSLDRFEARKRIIEDLKKIGALVKIEDYTHNVGHCYRCNTVVEPIISRQWFVKMKPLAAPAIVAVREGKIQFVPDRFARTYFTWMENIRDWCISRQLWWGHRIPAYYCTECSEMIVSKTAPDKCTACGGKLIQDEDVLDTWFSSALWPFSTLGWPDKTPDLEYFYPTDVLVTGYDIIFFWVARMIFSALEHTGKIPFKYVCVHGLVRDAQGRKMSKSLGNGIDPLEIVELYGADALRFSLSVGNSPGNDMRFYYEKVESARNFANKIWNASRFVLMNCDTAPSLSECKPDIADKWMLSKLNALVSEVTENLERFELGIAAQKLYDFIWSEFCDWYIEMTKPRLNGADELEKKTAQACLLHVLATALQLLHPFMPFITEEIWQHMPNTSGWIMLSRWPQVSGNDYAREQADMEKIMELIRGIRNMRAEMKVAPSVRTHLYIMSKNPKVIQESSVYIQKLAFASAISLISNEQEAPANCVSIVNEAATCLIPLGELVDIEKELERLKKELEGYDKEMERVTNKLANQGFISKAPASVVEEERRKAEKYNDLRAKTLERIEALKSAANAK
ncbi:MAG TPA: valine--tRNA ligase, partial [Clostridia bacterium]|nr:valine--tRNA ligase [Clostridia bacterium]